MCSLGIIERAAISDSVQKEWPFKRELYASTKMGERRSANIL